MNIGIVTTWFERGASYVSKQYMKVLEKEGHKVFIYARGGEEYGIGNKNWDLQNVYWSKKYPVLISTYIDIKEFEKWILKNGIETIIFNEQKWYPPILLANKLGIKTIAYIDYYTEETVPLFQVYDMLICNTKRHYNTFKWHPNVHYVPWGTNINLFKPQRNDNDKLVFFSSAGFAPERKGIHYILKSLEYLKGDFKVLIHSQINLRKIYPEYNIDKWIENGKLELVEKTVPAPGLYYRGDIYVYPSELDGLGLSLIEAISSGLAIITTNNAPMNEFVNDKFSKLINVKEYISRADGYYWPKAIIKVDDLVKKMQFFIDNRDRIYEYKKYARIYAEKYLNWENNSKRLNGIIENLEINSKKFAVYDKIDVFTRKQIYSNCSNVLYFKTKPVYLLLKKIKDAIKK